MDLSDFQKGMKDLTEFYSKSLREEALGLWFQKLERMDRQDWLIAIDEITANERQFPTPSIVLKFANEAKAKRATRQAIERENQEARLKAERETEARRFFDPRSHQSGIAKDAVEGILTLMRLPVDSRERAEFKRDFGKAMHVKYPNGGWQEIANEGQR